MASIRALAAADELPWVTMAMPRSLARRSEDRASSAWFLLSKRSMASGRAPPGSLTPPRALTRSVAQRLRNTASVLARAREASIMAMRMGRRAAGAWAQPDGTAQAKDAAARASRRRETVMQNSVVATPGLRPACRVRDRT